MNKILISYRREDSADVTGRIYDRLVQQFGRMAVFKDVDSIPLGVDFRAYLDEQVAKCDVFLAVIGRDWLGENNRKGKSRLEDPEDFVRIEIEFALKRQIPVIPVLVRDASIPPAERLPDSIQDLSFRHGIVVRTDPDFHRDMDRLIYHLRAKINGPEEQLKLPKARTIATAEEVHSEVVQWGKDRAEAVCPPSPLESPPLGVGPVEEDPVASKSVPRTIGLIVLIGGMLALLLALSMKHLQPTMIWISPGSFMMGESDSGQDNNPLHYVQLTRSFALAQYETTFDEFDQFATATGRGLPDDQGWGRGQRPVINVSWYDAKAYAKWLSQQTGKRYRLPTESEWEYAARSGGKQEYWAGTSSKAQLGEFAVFTGNAGHHTAQVGTKTKNSLGLYDLSGNVWEWVEDCWHPNYTNAPKDGSSWLAANGDNCGQRVLRGGSWDSSPENLRTSARFRYSSDDKSSDIGFRLAQDLDP